LRVAQTLKFSCSPRHFFFFTYIDGFPIYRALGFEWMSSLGWVGRVKFRISNIVASLSVI